jgi:hypothetical protein
MRTDAPGLEREEIGAVKTIHCSRCHEVGHNVTSCTKPVVRKLKPGVSGEDLARESGGGTVTEPRVSPVLRARLAKALATQARYSGLPEKNPVAPRVNPAIEHEAVLRIRLRVQLEVE